MYQRPKMSNMKQWVPGAVPFFLFGFVYYLVSPAFASQLLSADNEILRIATVYLESSYFNVYYFLDALSILVSFLLGYVLGRMVTRSNGSVLDYGAFQSSIPFYFAIMFGVLILYFALSAYMSGARFLTGYSTYNIQVLGPFSTAAFMTAWFANYFSKKQTGLLFLFFFIFCSVLLLGWGARMFFVLGFVALVLGAVSENRKLLKSVRLYAIAASLALLVVVVGVVRQGDGELSSDTLIGIFLAEPLFTSLSGSLYLENLGGRPVYGVPHDLFASVIHFIPSVVFPEKVALMRAITFDENLESPFGAKSLIVNLYSNFGRFYPIFLAILGLYFGFLSKKAQTSVFYRATYFSALPVLLLLFFREGLVTVMKVLFFNGFLVPLFVALLLIGLSPKTISEIRANLNRNRVNRNPAIKMRSSPSNRF